MTKQTACLAYKFWYKILFYFITMGLVREP